MNAVTSPAPSGKAAAVPPEADGAILHTLRRTGRKAVRFRGWQLVEALGAGGRQPVSHDLNVYRTASDEVVVELIARRSSEHGDISRVCTFADLAAAAAWLEAFGPAEDLPLPEGMTPAQGTLPWAMLQAVQLRQCIERVELEYRSLLSEVFAALDLTDPALVEPVAA